MNIKVIEGSAGSSADAISDLGKVDGLATSSKKINLFDQDRDRVPADEAIKSLDDNNTKLSINDIKFYQLIISPSERELKHIKSNDIALRDYTRKVIDVYAENFEKGIKGSDLVYVAKIEEFRIDPLTNENKPGLNWHVNVLVSRKDKTQKLKLSPLPTIRKGGNGPKKIDFDRNKFRQSSEDVFDKMFKYTRLTVDSFEYQNALKNNKNSSKKALAKKFLATNPKKVLGKLTEYLKLAEKEKPLKKEKKEKKDIDPS
jgi:hypothetical protein